MNKYLLTTLALVLVIFLSACSNTSEPASPVTQEIENTINTQDTEAEKNNATDETSSDTSTDPSDDSQESEPYYFDDLQFTTLSGDAASLYDYEGQIIILNFWATWCTYCEQEMPLLDELNAKEGYTVLAVDVGEDADTVSSYLERYGYDMDIFLDEDSSLASQFGISAFPTSIFIGPDFEYYYTYPGMLTDEYLDQILQAIDAYQSSK